MLALALLLTSATSHPLCARALQVAPELSCVAAGHGVALAATSDEADRLAGYAQAAEARLLCHLSVRPDLTDLAWLSVN